MRCLTALDIHKLPAKTFIGRVEKGFDWLGYSPASDDRRPAARTVDSFVARIARLYEHTSRRGECVRR